MDDVASPPVSLDVVLDIFVIVLLCAGGLMLRLLRLLRKRRLRGEEGKHQFLLALTVVNEIRFGNANA